MSKIHAAARKALADNLLRLLRERAPGVGINRVARHLKVSNGTLHRALSQETGVSIDTVERLAVALGVEPWALLVPEMEPGDRWVVIRYSALRDLQKQKLKSDAWDELHKFSEDLATDIVALLDAPSDGAGEDEGGPAGGRHSKRDT
jgi:transcriptional regulator with XRE-family HTH domain